MAREDVPERGLPSPEERRQIMHRAGLILDEARDLMARLDLHESFHPRSVREHQQVLERVRQHRCRPATNEAHAPAIAASQAYEAVEQFSAAT